MLNIVTLYLPTSYKVSTKTSVAGGAGDGHPGGKSFSGDVSRPWCRTCVCCDMSSDVKLGGGGGRHDAELVKDFLQSKEATLQQAGAGEY